MRKVLSAACLFLLAGSILAVSEEELRRFKFGDIIRFDNAQHYGVVFAVYDNGAHIFHHTDGQGCQDLVITPGTGITLHVDNYQDHEQAVDENNIRNRLNHCRQIVGNQQGIPNPTNICCGRMRPDNNCEHTATYIRYGDGGRVSCLDWWRSGNLNNGVRGNRPPQCARWTPPT